MAHPLYFCVDAGATRSRGRLCDAAGAVLAEAQAGSANFSYDAERAVASLRELWRKLAGASGSAHDPARTMFAIGGAGLYHGRAQQAFAPHFSDFAALFLMSDGYAALVGAGEGRPSALITIGTGVAGHRLFADGSSIQRDGWGWVAGDRGGGCWIGRRAIRHALEAFDGIVPASPLSEAVMALLGGGEGLLGGLLSGLGAQRLAEFAPIVLEQAERGCAVSSGILDRAAAHLADLAGALDCTDVPLYFNGGLARALAPRLLARIGRPAAEAAGDAMHGCLLVAQGKAPPERIVFGRGKGE